jgi:hypothetical protein
MSDLVVMATVGAITYILYRPRAGFVKLLPKTEFHLLPGDRCVVRVFYANAEVARVNLTKIHDALPVEVTMNIAVKIPQAIGMDRNMTQREVIKLPVSPD